MAHAKICGITTPEALDAALQHGARYVGFVFFARSPRNITLERAADLAARARGRADIVAVTVDASDGDLARISDAIKPDWVQTHGAESVGRVAEMRRLARTGVIKALGVARGADLDTAGAFEGAADMLMFDAKPAPGAMPGGNAQAFDWTILAGRRFARPWFLSGGLNPDNVGEAIAASGAALVDVSSGVESAPGLKDPARIAQFLAAVQQAR